MRYSILICGILGSLLVSSGATAGSVIVVPSAISEDAVFESLDKKEEDKEKPATFVSSENGAMAIVSKNCLITGSEEAQFSVCDSEKCESKEILLTKGSFLLHVGSTQVSFRIGDTVLRASEVRLVVWQTSKGWVVAAEKFFEDGSATIETQFTSPMPVKEKAQNSESLNNSDSKKKSKKKKKKKKNKQEDTLATDSKEAPLDTSSSVSPKTKKTKLEMGSPVHVIAGKTPQPSSFSTGVKMLQVVESFKDKPSTGSLLTPSDMESDDDIIAGKADQDREFEEIEIEEIEVEAGCVEVCLD